MKVVQKERVTYTKIYVANDGTEFLSEEDCKKYENSYRATVKKCYDSVPHIDFCPTDACLPFEYDDDREAHLFCPQSINDIVAINAYIDEQASYSGALDASYIGHHVAIIWGYDHDWCEWFDLDTYADEVKKAIDETIAKFDSKTQ